MKDIIDRSLVSVFIWNIAMFILGIMAIVNPLFTIESIGVIMAVFFIIIGIYLIYFDFKLRKFFIPFETIIPGILLLIFGVILFRHTDILNVMIPILVGVNIIAQAIYSMRISTLLRAAEGDNSWILTYILGILEIILGILLMFDPFSSSAIVTALGIILIIDSIFGIADGITFKRKERTLEKVIENKFGKNTDNN